MPRPTQADRFSGKRPRAFWGMHIAFGLIIVVMAVTGAVALTVPDLRTPLLIAHCVIGFVLLVLLVKHAAKSVKFYKAGMNKTDTDGVERVNTLLSRLGIPVVFLGTLITGLVAHMSTRGMDAAEIGINVPHLVFSILFVACVVAHLVSSMTLRKRYGK